MSELVTTTGDGAPAAATPLEEMSVLVAWGAAALFEAERGVNPQFSTYWDALHYVATSLSVGYANTFPVTPLGKIIGAVVMMVGPALSGRVFDHVERPTTPAPADPLLLAKLDEVIAELKKSRQPAG